MALRSLGQDTEFFGASLRGKIFPLNPDILSGTKEKPSKIGTHCYLQLDNVLGEITTPPAGDPSEFAHICHNSKQIVTQWLKEKHKIKPVFNSHHEFELEDVLTPWAMKNGCEMDFAANLADPCKPIDMQLFTTLKTASGHLHISTTNPLSAAQKIQYVRALDFALGAPLVLLHNDPKRRKLYGQAGRFRFKTYPNGSDGFEYRTPDNFWYGKDDQKLYYNIFDVIHYTMRLDPDDTRRWQGINDNHSDLCEAINLGNLDKIEELMGVNPFYQLDFGKGRKQKKPSGLRRGATFNPGATAAHMYYTGGLGQSVSLDSAVTLDSNQDIPLAASSPQGFQQFTNNHNHEEFDPENIPMPEDFDMEGPTSEDGS